MRIYYMEVKEMSTWYEIMMELRALLEERDPMEPDYYELAREEPTSQYQDSRDSAEAPGV